MDDYMAKEEAREEALDVIAEQLQSWIDHNKEYRDKEGLPTTEETKIISPPHWPSHGMVENWIKVLRSE